MTTDKLTVYEKPTCSKCRELDRLLRESGITYEKVNYYIEPLSREKLTGLLAKMGKTPRELLRTSEATYKELGLSSSVHTDEELISLMLEHPELLQRPIVERGERAVLGRPIENVKPLLEGLGRGAAPRT